MASKWLIAITLVLAVIAILALFSKKSVRAELVIPAQPEQVWSVITDPTSYPDWNPILVAIDGKFVEGQKLLVEMKNPDGSSTDVTATVRKMDSNKRLNQVGGIPGVLTFDHTWTLEAVEGGTRVTQFEEYRGIGVLFWDPSPVEAAYKQGNLNLRDQIGER